MLPILALVGFSCGVAGVEDSFDQGNTWQGWFRIGLALASYAAFAKSVMSLFSKPGVSRVPQDIARQTDAPKPPRANNGAGTIGTSVGEKASLDFHLRIARFFNAKDIRVNQEQVNADGVRVGRNRPDLQFTLFGKRLYIEYDRETSARGALHEDRIYANDPKGRVFQVTRN